MIEIYLKYDNMHKFGMINALNCINNHVISCINSMLSGSPLVTSLFDRKQDEGIHQDKNHMDTTKGWVHLCHAASHSRNH